MFPEASASTITFNILADAPESIYTNWYHLCTGISDLPQKIVNLHVKSDKMFYRKRLVLFSSVNLDNSYCIERLA